MFDLVEASPLGQVWHCPTNLCLVQSRATMSASYLQPVLVAAVAASFLLLSLNVYFHFIYLLCLFVSFSKNETKHSK